MMWRIYASVTNLLKLLNHSIRSKVMTDEIRTSDHCVFVGHFTSKDYSIIFTFFWNHSIYQHLGQLLLEYGWTISESIRFEAVRSWPRRWRAQCHQCWILYFAHSKQCSKVYVDCSKTNHWFVLFLNVLQHAERMAQ